MTLFTIKLNDIINTLGFADLRACPDLDVNNCKVLIVNPMSTYNVITDIESLICVFDKIRCGDISTKIVLLDGQYNYGKIDYIEFCGSNNNMLHLIGDGTNNYTCLNIANPHPLSFIKPDMITELRVVESTYVPSCLFANYQNLTSVSVHGCILGPIESSVIEKGYFNRCSMPDPNLTPKISDLCLVNMNIDNQSRLEYQFLEKLTIIGCTVTPQVIAYLGITKRELGNYDSYCFVGRKLIFLRIIGCMYFTPHNYINIEDHSLMSTLNYNKRKRSDSD